MHRVLVALHHHIWSTFTRDEGQGLTEYSLILALIAVVAIAALSFFGGKVTTELSTVANSVVA